MSAEISNNILNTPQTKKRYKNYSNSSRKRVLIAARNGLDWGIIAVSNGINISTASKWVRNDRKFLETPPLKRRGGLTHSKINETHMNFVSDLIEKRPQVTLNQIKDAIAVEFELTVSISTIGRHLDARFLCIKDTHFEPCTINNAVNKTKRKEYLSMLLKFQSEGKVVYYVDEINFNVVITRTKGQSKMGQRCKDINGSYRGENIHLIACINSNGLVFSEKKFGAYRIQDCQQTMRKILQTIKEQRKLDSVVIVLDNAKCHNRIEEVFNEPLFEAATLLRLGPCSPMLNPMESVFSVIKSSVKHYFTVNRQLILVPPEGTSVAKHRINMLEVATDTSMHNISSVTCKQAFSSTSKSHESVMELKDVEVGS